MDFTGFQDKINLMPSINRGYNPDFKIGANFLGSSESPFGVRSNLISKKEGLRMPFKNAMLGGSIWHRGVDKKSVMYEMSIDINKALGLTEIQCNGKRFILLENGNYLEFEILSEKQWVKKYPHLEYIKFYDGLYYRQHPDIASSLYVIENKSTNMPKSMWGDIGAYQIQQLNSYLGFLHKEYGFLFKVDLGATKEAPDPHGGYFNSGSTKFKYLWNKYFLFFPHNFSQNLFDYSIKRIKLYFKCIREEIDPVRVRCPEFIFECGDDCRNYCPNPIDKVKIDVNEVCFHCKEEIRAGSTALIRNNQTYHYTDGNRNRMEDCIKACKIASKPESE